MRKFLSTALESQHIGSSHGILSMEEEQVMLDEANQSAAAADDDLNDAERLIDVTDSMEDMAVIADGIEEATPGETQLMETVGSMAVAGSELEPEVIVPALESYVGRRISTESIRETAKAIWKQILQNLERVWAYIEDFFYKTFGTIPSLRKRVKSLRDSVDDQAGRQLEDKKIKVSIGVKALSVDHKTPSNEADLKKGLSTMAEAVAHTYGAGMDALASLGETIAKNISDFDPESADRSTKKFVVEVKQSLKKYVKDSGTNSDRFPGFIAKMQPALPGNVSLVTREPKGGTSDSNDTIDLEYLDKMRRSGVELVPTSEKDKAVPDSFDMTTMSHSGMTSTLDIIDKMLDNLETFGRGKRAAELKKTKSKLKSASEKAASAMEKAEKSDDAAEKRAAVYYRAQLNFNSAYARWGQSPAVPLLNASLATIRASMAVIQKSLGAYK
jgi:hypothetical protein